MKLTIRYTNGTTIELDGLTPDQARQLAKDLQPQAPVFYPSILPFIDQPNPQPFVPTFEVTWAWCTLHKVNDCQVCKPSSPTRTTSP